MSQLGPREVKSLSQVTQTGTVGWPDLSLEPTVLSRGLAASQGRKGTGFKSGLDENAESLHLILHSTARAGTLGPAQPGDPGVRSGPPRSKASSRGRVLAGRSAWRGAAARHIGGGCLRGLILFLKTLTRVHIHVKHTCFGAIDQGAESQLCNSQAVWRYLSEPQFSHL